MVMEYLMLMITVPIFLTQDVTKKVKYRSSSSS
jgi:hypothetical protein